MFTKNRPKTAQSQGSNSHFFFHELRHTASENFDEQFRDIFDAHGGVLTRGLVNTQEAI
jgi:hypothetical protein